MGRNLKLALTAATVVAFTGCQQPSDDEASIAPKNLYISSGLCTSGPGVTTYTAATASRAITKWSTTQASTQVSTVIDWNAASGFANSLPQQVILDNINNKLLILAENATTMTERKIYSVNKDDTAIYNTVVPNTASAPAAAATNIVRNILIDQDGYMTVNRTVAIEKFSPIGAVIPAPTDATAYINPAAATAPCTQAAISSIGTVTPAGTYNGISAIASLAPAFGRATGKTLFATMGSAAANNRLSAASFAGLTSTTVAHCNGGVAITSVVHNLATNLCPDGGCTATFDANGVSPTAMIFVQTPAPASTVGKLIVTYAPSNNAAGTANNTVNLNHGIVMWDVSEDTDTAVTFNNPIVLYNNDQVIVGPSALAYDATTSSLYVAVGPAVRNLNQAAGNQGYNVEKFTLNVNAATVERVHDGTFKPFITGNSSTKCISSMTIGD